MMTKISRRTSVVLLAAAGGLVSITHDGSGEINKPTVSVSDAKKNLSDLSSAIYQDAKKYNFALKENYAESVSKEIWPDVRYILERRFVVVEK
jgi:uncharacterized protein (DUF2141 family)